MKKIINDVEYDIRPGADLSSANLVRANLYEANLARANLYGADLARANLSEANLYRANLIWADLTGADLSEANLTGTNLIRANLTGADLRGTILSETDLAFAHINNTCLDSKNKPNADTHGFRKSRKSGLFVGYRSDYGMDMPSGYKYEVGCGYTAPYFSTSDTECHPGLYVWPNLEKALAWSPNSRIIRVEFKGDHCHKAGKKWRVKSFMVTGTARKTGRR